MKKLQLAILIFLLGAFALSCDKDTETDNQLEKETEPYSQIEKEILSIINLYRAENNCSELEMNEFLWHEARNHSEKMASGEIPFSHDGFYDRSNKIIAEFSLVKSVGENIAFGQKNAQTIVDSWLSSKMGHKENIEGDFNLTGIGIAVNESNSYYCTQIFVKRQ
jgi:uncharacterized protein YkwD